MNLNVIRTLTIRSKVEGAEKTQSDLKGIQAAHQGVARVSETSAKGQLSLADAVAKAERRFNTSMRAQQDFEKVQRQMNLAVAQNPALQSRANAVLAQAALHFDQVSRGQRAFAAATQAANDNLRGFVQSAGPLGGILSAMGPAGIAAAVGIGAAAIALHHMVTAATALAERAGKLKDFSETTGFTVLELQALEKAGAQVGVSAESVSRGLERFSVAMEDVKNRTGETFDKLRSLNPEMARQISNATSLQEAYELVSRAIRSTDVGQANQIARAFFGRGGVEQTRLMRAVAEAGGLRGVLQDLQKVDLITAQQAEKWDTLGDKINENMKAAKQNIASIFTEPVLEAAERFSRAFLEFSREVKQFGINEDLKKYMEFFSNPVVIGAVQGFILGSRGGVLGAAAGAVAGGGAAAFLSHADAEQSRQDIEKLRFELEQLQLVKAGASRRVLEAVDPAQVQQYATILERTNRRIAELNAQMASSGPTRLGVSGPQTYGPDGADRAAERARAAQEAFKLSTIQAYNEMATWMSILGSAATMAERFELATRRLAVAKVEGKINEEKYTRALAEQKQQLELRLGVANMAAVSEQKIAEVREVAAKAGLTEEQTRLAVQIAIAEAKEREIAAWKRANPEMATALNMAEQLTQSIVSAALAGGDLGKAMQNLSGTLASDAVRSFFKGDFLAAALQAIGSAIMALAGNMLKASDAGKKYADAMAIHLQNHKEIVQALSGDTLAGQLQLLEADTDQKKLDEINKFGHYLPSTQLLYEIKKQKIIEEFGQKAIEEEKRIADERLRIEEEAARVREATQRSREALFDRKLMAMDFFDDETLDGQVKRLQWQQMREREEILRTNAELEQDLAAAHHEETLQLTREFHKREIDEAKRAAQEKLDVETRAARGIVDFVLGLQAGPDSALSPSARLSAATQAVNATMALAQAGNMEALGRITQDVDNELKAARAFFGSSSGFQNLQNQRIAQLIGLPVVQTSSDPVVAAVRDVVTAVHATTTAVGGTTTAVGGTTTAVGGTTGAVNANTNAIVLDTQTTIVKFNETINKLNESVFYLTIAIDRLTTGNTLLDAIRVLQDIAKQQLELLNSNLAMTSVTTNVKTIGVSEQVTVNNKLLQSLNKIVVNTGATAFNTAQRVEQTNNTWARAYPVYAEGGWINGGIAGRDSVPLANGGLGMPGEFVVRRDIAQANSSWLPRFNETGSVPITPAMPSFGANDNGETRELRRQVADLTNEVRMLRQDNNRGHNNTATRVQQNTQHRDQQSGDLKQVARIESRKAAGRR